VTSASPGRANVTLRALESGAVSEFAAAAIVPALFADGFESGDTSRWSDTFPTPPG